MLLTLNAGSSSVKFAVFALGNEEAEVCSGIVEEINSEQGSFSVEYGNHSEKNGFTGDLAAAFRVIAGFLEKVGLLDQLSGVAHRVVHGGEHFRKPTLITPEVERAIEELSDLAPLHNPANLLGIHSAQQVLAKAGKSVPHVAIFDTAFHSTLPPQAFRYAVPTEWYTAFGVRKYGFHGTSHAFVSAEARQVLAKAGKKNSRIITLHLGNGCSAAAILDGKSQDTSMGLTPLEGLVMGTRSGDVDPGLPKYMSSQGVDLTSYDRALNKASGLLGIAGTNDMRTLLEKRDSGDASAKLAIDMFTYRLRKTIGAYAATLGGLDALVFTGGIGENAAAIRKETCDGLSFLGVEINEAANLTRSSSAREIGTGQVAVLVVPTNEELEMARAAHVLISTSASN